MILCIMLLLTVVNAVLTINLCIILVSTHVGSELTFTVLQLHIAVIDSCLQICYQYVQLLMQKYNSILKCFQPIMQMYSPSSSICQYALK